MLVTLWAESTLFSLLVWLTLLLGGLYLARKRVHALILTASHLLIRQLRHLSRRLLAAGAFIRRSNRKYLLTLARDQTNRAIERELKYIASGIERDLANFPILSRRLSDQIACVDQDYRDSATSPPQPPEWLEAVSTLRRGSGRNDPAVQRILEDINNTLERAAHQALLEYKAAHRRRHRLLGRMQAYWRRVEHRLGTLEAAIAELNRRSQRIDRAMMHLHNQRIESSVRRISSAASIRFLIAVTVLGAALPGTLVALELIARPIAEVTAGTDAIAGIAFYNIAAAATLITEMVAGTLVLEGMGITRLFPTVAALKPQVRSYLRIVAASIFLLTVLGATTLAWTRDYLINQDIALVGLLEAGQASFPAPVFHWIPAVAHSALTLGLGFLLGALAIPMENALQAGRFVLGSGLALSLTAMGELCHLGATACFWIGRLLIQAYDLAIVIPLQLEALWLHVRQKRLTDRVTYFYSNQSKATEAFEKRRAQQ